MGSFVRGVNVIVLCGLLFVSSAALPFGPTGHLRVLVENWGTLKGMYDPSLPDIVADRYALAAVSGALVSDIGSVVPGDGARHFTNLVHYVRTGDFVLALLNETVSGGTCQLSTESKKQQDLLRVFSVAFATHYFADRFGHEQATNVLVGLTSKKATEKLPLAYEEDMGLHIDIEAQMMVEGDLVVRTLLSTAIQ